VKPQWRRNRPPSSLAASPVVGPLLSTCRMTGASPLRIRYVLSRIADIHEGTPLGRFEIVHGVRTYVSDPKPPAAGQKQDGESSLPTHCAPAG
jgi:hypothetical protein